jgi:hypothetical protein
MSFINWIKFEPKFHAHQNDETLTKFINPKHPTKGENKEQNERTHDRIKKQKLPTRGAIKRSGKKSSTCPSSQEACQKRKGDVH